MKGYDKMSHNNQKKIAVINDFSGFGRCSIAVSLPIISAMKIQCCPLITSVFSNHTGFEDYFFDDYTRNMEEYASKWKKLDLRFKGICTGFLGSAKQISIVEKFVKDFRTEDTVVVVDPVMGDYGKAYATYTEQMCSKMKEMIDFADILTPNLTEACILTDTEYRHEGWSEESVRELAIKLSGEGKRKVVITGIYMEDYIGNYIYEQGKYETMIKSHIVGEERSGTGDIFSSIIVADAVNGVDFKESVEKAAAFICKCIAKSIEMNIPKTDGVCFEELLHELI